MLSAWTVRFCHRVSQLRGGESDEEAMRQLSRLARSAQEIVAMCMPNDSDFVDVQTVAVRWLQRFFAACGGDVEGSADIDEARMRQVLATGLRTEGDPRLSLEVLGASVPLDLPEETVEAIWARVAEAQLSGEEEIFTGAAIVAEGCLAPGTAAVLRARGGAGAAPHVFLYHLASIQQWQAQDGTDPCTREALHAWEILALS